MFQGPVENNVSEMRLFMELGIIPKSFAEEAVLWNNRVVAAMLERDL
jgi:hypothetical protein